MSQPPPAVQVAARLTGAPLPDVTVLVDRDPPGLLRDGRDRGLLPRAQVTISRRRNAGGSAVIAASSTAR
jgi:hypothetical protein